MQRFIPRSPIFTILLTIILFVCSVVVVVLSAAADEGRGANHPKLIVQITVDQFRADYLQRFAPALTRGFRRVQAGGLMDATGTVDHAITNSYPGHAALATGAYPASHGLSANEWWVLNDEGVWNWIDAGSDTETRFVGTGGVQANETDIRVSRSPHNIRMATLGDWVKQVDPAARSISIAASEIAVAYGGRASDGVYWYDVRAGEFVTSSYYRDVLADWVSAFNTDSLQSFKTDVWDNSVPQSLRSLAEADEQDYENFGTDTTFSHRFDDMFDSSSDVPRERQYLNWFGGTPMRDLATLDLAKNAIKAEQLGQRGRVDYLSVTLSATDDIGHTFGGRSQEALDAFYRIDGALEDFLAFLDAQLGPDGYVLAIAGDHGAPDVVEYMIAEHGVGRRIAVAEIDAILDQIDALGEGFEGSESELTRDIERVLEAQDWVADAITEDEVYGRIAWDNPYADLYRKSWVMGRIPDFPLWTSTPNRPHHPARYGIYVQFQAYTYFDFGVVVHGSPYEYDRSVPIIFYGAGVRAGSRDSIRTIDVAPTLASLAGIYIPPMVDGTALGSMQK